jgi:hypothetical protein
MAWSAVASLDQCCDIRSVARKIVAPLPRRWAIFVPPRSCWRMASFPAAKLIRGDTHPQALLCSAFLIRIRLVKLLSSVAVIATFCGGIETVQTNTISVSWRRPDSRQLFFHHAVARAHGGLAWQNFAYERMAALIVVRQVGIVEHADELIAGCIPTEKCDRSCTRDEGGSQKALESDNESNYPTSILKGLAGVERRGKSNQLCRQQQDEECPTRHKPRQTWVAER